MKPPFLTLALSAALFCGALPVAYADAAPKSSVTKAEKGKKAKKNKKAQKPGKVVGAVGQYMSELKEDHIWFGDKPATDAEFYIYLISASWCGPCNAEMPHVVEAYKKMREAGKVELVLISADSTAEAAKGFAEKYGAEFTVINARGEGSTPPPGFVKPEGIPHATIVDNEGNIIKDGHGAIVQNWEALTVNNPDYASKSKAASTKRKAAAEKKKAKKK
ncbi:MAG: TlpA family protein disulfide reductase [Akkermansia sp.]|nr:TlpA family protein disulfide reductase [Akkermansia sp.]